MSQTQTALERRIRSRLERMQADGLQRTLRPPQGVDLCSNDYLQLATDLTPDQASALLEEHRAKRLSARDLKEAMAHALVRLCHGEPEAKAAELEFRRVFRDKGAPADLVAMKIPKSIDLSALLVSLQAAKSLSEARRLVGQGAVTLDGERLTGSEQLGPQTQGILRVGKHRFWKLG